MVFIKLIRRAGSLLRAIVIAVGCYACAWAPLSQAQSFPDAQRVVSIGGAITEIIYALGEEHRLVARDVTSNYPAAAENLPDVGYIRRLSPEGVLSVEPDLIIGQEGMGPPEAVALLGSAAVPFVVIPEGYTAEAVSHKILGVAQALGVPGKGAALESEIRGRIAAAADAARGPGKPPRVLFVLSMQGGRVLAAGSETPADGIITLAGGVNAANGFKGFKPMSNEAVTQSGADVILMMDRTGDHAMADEDLFAHPALKVLPAAETRAVVRMEGMLLLGFSVRTAEAVEALSAALAQAGG